MELLTERYAAQIRGVIGCYDRLLAQGTLPKLCYAEGITGYFHARRLRIFDYPRWAETLRNQLRENAERLAIEAGISIEFLAKKSFRKEDRVREILDKRGEQPGLVCVLSAMEPCATYKPWYDKSNGKTYFKRGDAKCLHYYFYFIDEELGLCYARVPTWCPFRLQIYWNGHNWLARQLTKHRIAYRLLDNAFIEIADFSRAQKLSDGLRPEAIHRRLDQIAQLYCPVVVTLELSYHWSIDQAEYATDIIFRRQKDLAAIYDHLTRTAIHTVKPQHIATFLGKQIQPAYRDEVGNRYDLRIQGTRIRHTMGPTSIKIYDKFGQILRIEVSTNNVSFFPHYREVEHRDGSRYTRWTYMKKSIYSLAVLAQVMTAANRRYLEFISAIETPSAGLTKLDKISRTTRDGDRSFRGLNFFCREDQRLLEILARGEFNINGFRNRTLRELMPDKNSGQTSRLLQALLSHSIIKKVARTYKYYLTKLGKQVIATGLHLKELFLVPQLALCPA
jgi:hypothetical protein